jgi:uncharacterized repeat protein (TIGR03806 family)
MFRIEKLLLKFGTTAGLLAGVCSLSIAAEAPYALAARPLSKPYLNLPDRADGQLLLHLSETGAFRDLARLSPAEALIPYDINVSFWSDGAHKKRWVSVPNEGSGNAQKINFSPTGEWKFPKGTVFVKHFEMPVDETRPELRRRLETRFIVCDSTGSVYGVTYKWRPDNSDADLLETNLTELIPIKTASGMRTQSWYYPSRQDCRTCHTDLAGGVLGVKTRQLNCDFSYPSGIKDNQLRSWNHAGLFEPALAESQIPMLPRLATSNETGKSIEDRARSYLDANCAHCHRPSGTVAMFDARYDTPLEKQNLIDGPVLIDQGVDKARAIAPNDPWRSIVLMRLSSLEGMKMPPLAHQVLDENGSALVKQWILSMPGPPVLACPDISPRGGPFNASTRITLHHAEPGAVIHYTLDGSAPNNSDPVYQEPIQLTGPAVVRARAYKPGFTRSIVSQEVYSE